MSISSAPAPRATPQRKHRTMGNLAALALHGPTSGHYANDRVFVERLSTQFVRSVPTTKADTVTFSFADRVAAWMSGWGTELRQLKEMQLDDPLGPDGSRTSEVSRLTRLHRRSLVLVGAEGVVLNKDGFRPDGELKDLSPPQLVRAMSDMMLKAHVDAAYGMSYARASAKEIRDFFRMMHDEHQLSLLERLVLTFGADDEFTEEQRDVLLGRTPRAELDQLLGRAPPAPTRAARHAPSPTTMTTSEDGAPAAARADEAVPPGRPTQTFSSFHAEPGSPQWRQAQDLANRI